MQSIIIKLGIGIAVIAAIFFTIKHLEHRAYQQGEAAQAERYRKIVQQNDELNRKLEVALQGHTDDLNRDLNDRLDQLEKDHQSRAQKITTIMAKDDCTVSPAVIDLLNEDRK